jgi:formylglycine-generating enzyme required for sulfatase activity
LERRIKAFEKYQQSTPDNPVHDILGDRLSQLKEIRDLHNQIKAADSAKAEIAKKKEELEKQIATLERELTWRNQFGMTFVYISPGTFMMGSPKNESGRFDDETLHEVTLTQGFYLQSTPVTQGQWKVVMGNNPSRFKDCGDDCPIENVSWNDAQEFIKRLNGKEGKTYRLPTEAEWEYACRAGSTSRYCFGDDEGKLSEYAWYTDNSGGRTHPVGTKKPNDWGLYDMHGNVWEWCEDWYGDYPSGKVTDPAGPSTGSERVLRGGGWGSDARTCRSATRSGGAPVNRFGIIGFRLSFSRS